MGINMTVYLGSKVVQELNVTLAPHTSQTLYTCNSIPPCAYVRLCVFVYAVTNTHLSVLITMARYTQVFLYTNNAIPYLSSFADRLVLSQLSLQVLHGLCLLLGLFS